MLRESECPNCKQSFAPRVQYSKGYIVWAECVCDKCQRTLKSDGKQSVLDEFNKRYSKLMLEWVDKQVREDWADQQITKTKYVDMTLESFSKERQPQALGIVSSYSWDSDPAKSLILFSANSYGVGKTHLVRGLIAKMVAEATATRLGNDGSIIVSRFPAYFTTETLLMARIRATFSPQKSTEDWNVRGDNYHETDEDVYQELSSHHLLIIDDVGKVRPRDLSFLQSVYYRIVDERYCDNKPIILTSNLSEDELEAHIGGACADRLFEMCGPTNFVKMTGKSYRREHGIGK